METRNSEPHYYGVFPAAFRLVAQKANIHSNTLHRQNINFPSGNKI